VIVILLPSSFQVPASSLPVPFSSSVPSAFSSIDMPFVALLMASATVGAAAAS